MKKWDNSKYFFTLYSYIQYIRRAGEDVPAGERVLSALRELQAAGGKAFLVEGESGVGRTRFLAEVAVMARLTGVLTLRVDASAGQRPYAAANALCLLALSIVPEAARGAAAGHEPVLSRLSEQLHAELDGGPIAASSDMPGEDRALALAALRALFLALSQQRPTALLIDDLQAMDEESQGLFAALSHSLREQRLVMVASTQRTEAHDNEMCVL